MYSEYEKPIINCSIFYYDIKYDKKIGEQVIEILEKHNMFPPEKFHAGKLTKNRFVYADENSKNLLAQAYSEKDVLGIDMSSGNSRKMIDYWRVEWNWTFYKNSKLAVIPKILPWNVLSLQSTHGRLNDSENYRNFFDCIKELIEILQPFYACIDDVDNKVMLMNRARESHFVPNRIQEIYWGNYFGKQYCEQYGIEKIQNIPAKQVEKIGGGVFFTLSEHILEYDSNESRVARSMIKRYLKSTSNKFPRF